MAGSRLLGRTNLDQILDLEPRATKQPDPVAVREMELDARIARPLDAIHAEGRAQQSIRRRDAVLRRHAERQQERVDEENQPPSRP